MFSDGQKELLYLSVVALLSVSDTVLSKASHNICICKLCGSRFKKVHIPPKQTTACRVPRDRRWVVSRGQKMGSGRQRGPRTTLNEMTSGFMRVTEQPIIQERERRAMGTLECRVGVICHRMTVKHKIPMRHVEQNTDVCEGSLTVYEKKPF